MRKLMIIFSVLFVVGGGIANADVIFSNLGGDSFSPFSLGYVITRDISQGFMFEVDGDYMISSISLEVANASFFEGIDMVNFSVSIYPDSGGYPGLPLSTISLPLFFSFGRPEIIPVPYLLSTSSLAFPIYEGSYWMVARVFGPGTAIWYLDSQGLDFGMGYTETSLGGVTFPGIRAAFSIEGASLNPVPEPATIFLLGAGLVGFLGSRRAAK